MRGRNVLLPALIGALLIGLRLSAAQVNGEGPQVAPLYTPPAVQAVREGKAPLRILMALRKPVLAWKGDAAIRATSLPGNTDTYATKPGQIVGLVYDAVSKGCQLRQDGKNFCAVQSVLKLQSSQPIKLWTPNPDAWQVLPSPVYIIPVPDGTFSAAIDVPLEAYVRAVAPLEMPDSFHPQALRAQAVIARTYALSKIGRHADAGGDLCADVHCQMFRPDAPRAKATDDAVNATKGLILLAGGKVAEPYYHSNCGGVTDDAGALWGPEYARPYLRGVPDTCNGKAPLLADLLTGVDTHCKAAGNRFWTRKFTPQQVNTLVWKNLPLVTGDPFTKIANVSNMRVEQRTERGRVATLRVEGDGASVVVAGDAVRWLFGNGRPGADGLWSTLFQLTVNRDTTGKILDFTFMGAGRGHGIGLCQWGANGRAKAGQSCRDILHAYYPGLVLSDEKAGNAK